MTSPIEMICAHCKLPILDGEDVRGSYPSIGTQYTAHTAKETCIKRLTLRNAELQQFHDWASPQLILHGADQEKIAELESTLGACQSALDLAEQDIARLRFDEARTLQRDTPENTGVGKLCTPGPAADQEQRYLLMFDDADKGYTTFDDMDQARNAFAQSEGRGWNCHLFQLMPRVLVPPTNDRFKVGDRVEWTNYLGNTFSGTVERYVIQLDDGSATNQALGTEMRLIEPGDTSAGHIYSPREGTEVCFICGFHKREHAPEHIPAGEPAVSHHSELATIKARDESAAATWFEGPASPKSQCFRDRRALLTYIEAHAKAPLVGAVGSE